MSTLPCLLLIISIDPPVSAKKIPDLSHPFRSDGLATGIWASSVLSNFISVTMGNDPEANTVRGRVPACTRRASIGMHDVTAHDAVPADRMPICLRGCAVQKVGIAQALQGAFLVATAIPGGWGQDATVLASASEHDAPMPVAKCETLWQPAGVAFMCCKERPLQLVRLKAAVGLYVAMDHDNVLMACLCECASCWYTGA